MLHIRLAVYCMCAYWNTRSLHLSALPRWTQITYAKRASNVSPCCFALLLLCFSCRDLQKTDRFPPPSLLLVVDIACFSDKRKGRTNLKGLVHHVTVGLFLRCAWSRTSSSLPCLVVTKINSCWRGVHHSNSCLLRIRSLEALLVVREIIKKAGLSNVLIHSSITLGLLSPLTETSVVLNGWKWTVWVCCACGEEFR